MNLLAAELRGIRFAVEKIIRTIEPLSGELMDLDLQEILITNGFQIQKEVLGTFALYQFIIAKKMRY